MLVLPGMRGDLLDLGGCDVFGENPAFTATFRMNLEHHARCAFAVHGKKFLQYANNEVHWSEIIVEEQHFVHARWADSRLFGLQQRIVLFPNGHEKHSNQAMEDGKRRTALSITRRFCVTKRLPVVALQPRARHVFNLSVKPGRRVCILAPRCRISSGRCCIAANFCVTKPLTGYAHVGKAVLTCWVVVTV